MHARSPQDETLGKKPLLVLASESLSRQHLLRQLGLPFIQWASHSDETPLPRELPHIYVQRVAENKMNLARPVHPGYPILAADTIVSLGTRLLRKAESPQESYQQMRLLSGRGHKVYTGVVLYNPTPTGGHVTRRLCITRVTFKSLENWEIQEFVDSGDWKDVSVYRYEGLAGRFIRNLSGQPSTLGGLPLFQVYQMLRGQNLWPVGGA